MKAEHDIGINPDLSSARNDRPDSKEEPDEAVGPIFFVIDTAGLGSEATREEIAQGSAPCAVHQCKAPISGPGYLCDEHRLPGMVVSVNNITFVMTTWAVEHGDESGIIILNDFALGDLFAGRAGFEKRLREQGFTGIRLIRTPEELESAKQPVDGKKLGVWSGPWNMQYPWETGAEETKCK
jgi:hypothetical protein